MDLLFITEDMYLYQLHKLHQHTRKHTSWVKCDAGQYNSPARNTPVKLAVWCSAFVFTVRDIFIIALQNNVLPWDD